MFGSYGITLSPQTFFSQIEVWMSLLLVLFADPLMSLLLGITITLSCDSVIHIWNLCPSKPHLLWPSESFYSWFKNCATSLDPSSYNTPLACKEQKDLPICPSFPLLLLRMPLIVLLNFSLLATII